jgi:putative spermidine/putrescine transport system ATP-binding protein
LQSELRRLHADLGLTTIYVTHDQREAIALSDRIALMREGRIAQIGSPRELYERPVDEFVARFLGDSSILPLERRAGGLFYRDQRIAEDANVLPAGPVGLLIRPEKLRVSQSYSARGLFFSGKLADMLYEGGSYRVDVLLEDGRTLSARDPTVGHEDAERMRRETSVQLALSFSDVALVALDA